MASILTIFSSLAEPTRLALMGTSLIFGALLLRKLLLPGQHALRATTKAESEAK